VGVVDVKIKVVEKNKAIEKNKTVIGKNKAKNRV